MLRQFAHKVEDMRRLIDEQRSASFLVAVSGGMDSMCLLDLFSKVLPSSEFAVAHCNFSLRGEESDGDQALVEARAAELGVQTFVKRFDTEAYARENGVSIEMAARELRYEWFAGLCSEYGYDAVAVAHNANDNAETLILNLLRGTGLNGLHGMSSPPSGKSALNNGEIFLFRPLLEFTRKQIEGYVFCNRVKYRHDSSNFTSDYKRNKIRNEVFPIFEKINPSFIRTLNREIGYFAEAGSIVEEWCRYQMSSVLLGGPSESRYPSISIDRLLATPNWRYLLYYILSPYGFNHQTLASIESLLTSERTVSGKYFESPDYTLCTGRNTLTLAPRYSSPEVDMHPNEQHTCVVRGDGIYNFNGSRFCVETLIRTPEMSLKQPAGTLIFDADSLCFPFVCRKWRQGDWLVPFGMHGKKKVSDLFTDLKYDAPAKDSALIIVDTSTPELAEQQHVAALLGVRIDNRYKVTSSTGKLIRITIL